jgi:transposase
MSQSIAVVGLDVHAEQTAAAVIDPATGELRRARIRGATAELLAFLETLGPHRAVYEAGPTGLGLARRAQAQGLDLRVCAPGSVPRAPTDRSKTDARDAERLARLLAAGELSFARVPTIDEERFRDLVRAREDLRRDLMRARHRLSKFMLRLELRYPRRGGAWSRDHLDWLRAMRFDDEPSEITFRDYLAAVELLLQRRGVLDDAIARLAPGSPYGELIARFRCFRGIDTLTAAGICVEAGNFERFRKPNSCRAIWGSCRQNGRRASAAAYRGSPRQAQDTRAACWSRPPTTAVTAPTSPPSWSAASAARTRAWWRSRGAASSACMNGGEFAARKAQARRGGVDRARTRARCVSVGGGLARLSRARIAPRRCRGAHGDRHGPASRIEVPATSRWAVGQAGGARR